MVVFDIFNVNDVPNVRQTQIELRHVDIPILVALLKCSIDMYTLIALLPLCRTCCSILRQDTHTRGQLFDGK